MGRKESYLPITVLAAAMALVAFHLVPVTVAFFGAAVLLLLARSLSLREAYDVIDWPILVMLGALIPVSDSLRTTGGTDLIAGWLSAAAAQLPAAGALALILAAAMAVTPFLNNAATVLVMAPIAASFAAKLSHNPDPFLMAVAIGAACDFLTPIGHQCNTLVMGSGGYRFDDYWKLGLPPFDHPAHGRRTADHDFLADRPVARISARAMRSPRTRPWSEERRLARRRRSHSGRHTRSPPAAASCARKNRSPS
jgi:di/tricarboxylate transporter